MTYKVIALDEGSEVPFTLGIFSSQEDAQCVADSFNLWHDKWNTLATAHVIENN